MKKSIKYKAIIALLIIVISILHYFVGSLDSPIHNFYRLLYYIPIILAAFNFGFRGGVITSLVVSLIYSPFLLLSLGAFGWKTANELLDVVLFFAIGVVTGILVEKKNISLSKLDSELKRYVLLENYMNNIIESIKGGVVAVNNDLLITMINQGAKNILKVNSDCIGQNFTDVFSCCENVKKKISDSISYNKPNENIIESLNLKGDEAIIKVSLFPLNLEGINKGLVITIDEITELQKLQNQIQRNEKLAALGELSTGIAHEIRNPLGIIKAIEQTMKKELIYNKEVVKELDIIDEEIERANKVVKALMEFGKPAKHEKLIYSINNILEDVLIIMNKYFAQHKVEVTINTCETEDILVDKEQLKQAFINIIFNAVQAMPHGGKLSITTQNEQNAIQLIFVDTGSGIEARNIDKIFNPFFTTKDEGTGLGLSITHRIIEEHSGIINISSELNVGTTFEIILPKKEIII